MLAARTPESSHFYTSSAAALMASKKRRVEDRHCRGHLLRRSTQYRFRALQALQEAAAYGDESALKSLTAGSSGMLASSGQYP